MRKFAFIFLCLVGSLPAFGGSVIPSEIVGRIILDEVFGGTGLAARAGLERGRTSIGETLTSLRRGNPAAQQLATVLESRISSIRSRMDAELKSGKLSNEDGQVQTALRRIVREELSVHESRGFERMPGDEKIEFVAAQESRGYAHIEKGFVHGASNLSSVPPGVDPSDFARFLQSEEFPKDLLLKYDSKTLGEMLVARLHERYEVGKLIQPDNSDIFQYHHVQDYDYFGESEVQLFFSAKNAESIAEKGFLNLHQTGKTPAANNPEARMMVERHISGLNLPDYFDAQLVSPAEAATLKELLPKYANLQMTRDIQVKANFSLEDLAGETIAVFKPDVKRRMTWNKGDSFVSRGLNSFKYDPSITAKRVQEGQMGSVYSVHATGLKLFSPGLQQYGYWEAQVWGRLDVSDLEYLMVAPKTPHEVLESLKKMGVPIYEWKKVPKKFYYKSHGLQSKIVPENTPGAIGDVYRVYYVQGHLLF